MMTEKEVADRINDRVVNSNTLWNSSDSEEQRQIITDIVIEETGFDYIQKADEISMVVDKLCQTYSIGEDDEFEDVDDPNDYEYSDREANEDISNMHDWIESHDEVTPEVLEEALNNMENLSKFDYDPSEFNRRMHELAEEYEIDEEEIEDYLD